MAKKLMRVLCLLVSIAMLVCSVACKSSDDKPDASSETPTVSNSEVASPSGDEQESSEIETGDASGDTTDIESDPLLNWDEEIGGGIDDSTVGFYLPEYYHYSTSVLDDGLIDGDDEGFGDDLVDIGADDELVFGEVEGPIQMYGEPVSGENRVFNVETDNVVYDDFVGYGSNVFPTQLMPETVDRYPFVSDVTFEVERDRWMAIKGHMYRCWFQVDWITTTDEANPTREDYENNKDYQNYKKGIYDFDSERMKDVYPYFDVWKDAGSELCLNFGWKASTDIQTWFCFPGLADPQASAPMELDAFGRAAAASVKEFRHNRGYDNLTMLSFYNEPGHDYDFVTYLNTEAYWVMMLQYTNKWLEEFGVDDEVQVWSCGENSMNAQHYEFTAAVKELGADEFDIYDGHYYYGRIEEMYNNNYEYAFKLFSFFREYFNEHVFYITENYCGEYGRGPDTHVEGENWTGIYYWWNDSTASFIIAGANSGMRCLLKWGYTGGCLPNPQFFNPASGSFASWRNTDSQETLENGVNLAFYDEALITTYIPAHSDTLQVDWTGDDIRGSAFKTPDGGYTILVEANGSENETDGTEWEVNTTERNLTINLKGNNKKLKFYRYYFNNDVALDNLNQHATIITYDKTIEATSKIIDTIDETHAMYVYTTVPPTKQIEIASTDGAINYWVEPGASIDLSAKMLDCAANDEIVWSVSATNFDGKYDGTMTGYDGDMSNPNILGTGDTVTYSIPADYPRSSMIAIRASLKSDPKVFDVAVIQVGSDS